LPKIKVEELIVKVFYTGDKTAAIVVYNIRAAKTLISTCLAVWHGFGKLITILRSKLNKIKNSALILTFK
jgi:hypothetical protein